MNVHVKNDKELAAIFAILDSLGYTWASGHKPAEWGGATAPATLRLAAGEIMQGPLGDDVVPFDKLDIGRIPALGFKIGPHLVDVLADGAVKVGCTTFPRETVARLIGLSRSGVVVDGRRSEVKIYSDGSMMIGGVAVTTQHIEAIERLIS